MPSVTEHTEQVKTRLQNFSRVLTEAVGIKDRLGEKLTYTGQELSEKSKEIAGKLKISAQSVVRGVVKEVKNIKITKPSKKTLLNIERAAWAGLGIVGVAGAIQVGSMINRAASQRETAAPPAGSPSTTLEVGSSQQDESGTLDAGRIAEIMDAAAQQPSSQLEGNQESSFATADQPSQTAGEETQEVSSTQGTVDYTSFVNMMSERGFQVKVEADGGVTWTPMAWNEETGQGTWEIFLRNALGYKNIDIYGDPNNPDPDKREGLLDRFDLRENMPRAGQPIDIDPKLILESPAYTTSQLPITG